MHGFFELWWHIRVIRMGFMIPTADLNRYIISADLNRESRQLISSEWCYRHGFYIFTGCRLCSRTQNKIRFLDAFWLEMVGLDWKLNVWCIPNPVFCVVQPCRVLCFEINITFVRKKNTMFNYFSMLLCQNEHTLLLNRWTVNENGILDLIIEFGWVP